MFMVYNFFNFVIPAKAEIHITKVLSSFGYENPHRQKGLTEKVSPYYLWNNKIGLRCIFEMCKFRINQIIVL